MTTATIKSQTSNAEYTLYFNSKKQAIGCSCPSRKFNPSKPCKHMTAANELKVVEQPAVNSCAICGHPLHSDSWVCGYCIGY